MKFFVESKISDNMYKTPEGFLVCVGVAIARTGNQLYGDGETPLEVGPEGTIEIYRDEKEVFRPETIASFNGKPVTIGHPDDFVNPENFRELAKGIIQNPRRGKADQKDDLIADIVIMDREAIEEVENGLREVSCGYEAEYTQTEPGKGAQTKIIGNHLALVDEGRAGSSYAINDHKGAGHVKKSLKERIAAILGRAQDEATKLLEAENKGKTTDEDKEDDKEKAKDAGSYDELVKCFKDLGEMISKMGEKKADDEEKPDDKKDKEKSKDDDLSGRLEKLEAAVAKLLEKKASGDEEEEAEGVDEESEEESEDDDFEETTMVGDAAEVAAKAEILSPGIKMSKDLKSVKAKALKAAYDTDDGKKVIGKLTGGKAPAYDSAEQVDLIFNAAAELLKTDRNEKNSNTKKKTTDGDFNSQMGIPSGAMTPEKMNEINAKHFSKK